MKKRIWLMVVLILSVLLAACTGNNETLPESGQYMQADTEPVTVSAPGLPEVSVNETIPSDDSPAVAFIEGSGVNLRLMPSLKAAVVEVLSDKTEVKLLAKENNWFFVQAGEQEGYVFEEYITLEKSEEKAQTADEGETETAVFNATSNSFIIAIDPGHQAKGNSEHEPIGPGASQTKPKVASGTQGVSTKVPEYELTLEISLKLRDELLARGYNVYMIRETHDVNISNRERAALAAEAQADIFVRIHADGSADGSVNGILTLSPSKNNPYISDLYVQSRALSDAVLAAMVEATGAKNRGVSEVDNMSGINWAAMPVTIVEMGLMSNPKEDELMQTAEYQQKLVMGIAGGIDRYFSSLLQNGGS